MSETVTIEAGEPESAQRPTRRPREAREVQAADPPAISIETDSTGTSADQAAAHAASQLQESNRQIAEARRQARDADQRRIAAETARAQAEAGRHTDQQSVVAAAIETADESLRNARLAYRSAREAGDIEGEVAAQEAMAGAIHRKGNATAELERLKQGAPTQARPAGQAQQGGGAPAVTAETQAWLDSHPRYYTDRLYQGAAHGAHQEAIDLGMRSGSQSYVDHIERRLTEMYGDAHGDGGAAAPAQRREAVPPRASSSVTPSRQAGGATPAGYKTLTNDLGNIMVQRRPDGTMSVRGSPEAIENWKAGAETCRMTLQEYVTDYLDNGNEGLLRGEGALYR